MKLVIWTQVVDKHDPLLGFFHDWIKTFAKKFERVDVICFSSGEINLPDNVKIHTLGKAAGFSKFRQLINFYKHFARLVNNDTDYVLFHMGAIMNILAVPFYFSKKIKRHRTTYLWWKTHGHINLVGRLALLFVDRIYTASKESFPIKTSKKKVVGHAIDTDLFVDKNEHSEPVILVVGRKMSRKRIEKALTIASNLKLTGENFSMKIIGPDSNSEYLNKLKNIISEQTLEPEVLLLSAMTQIDLNEEYSKAQLLLNMSDTDSVDKVVLEAMASGVIPVTCTNAFADILSSYKLFFSKDDIDGMSNRVKELLHNPTERSTIKGKLRDIVVDKHSLATISNRIFN